MSVDGKSKAGPNIRSKGKNDSARPEKSDERDVGAALRVAYQATVEETIPPEMLDLLGKLR